MATSRVTPLRPSVRFSPVDSHSYPRAHSRSPERKTTPNYEAIDPLLSNLSPESTLRALSSTDAVPKNEKVAHDILSKSISQVSPAERALGIRAAIAAQKLGQWYKEVQSWQWPKRADIHLGKGFIPPPSPSEGEYYGSLPAVVVKEHEDRVEEIRDGMDGLDVDELKEHVLNAHIPARSRPSSSSSTITIPPPLSYIQLSDFTAVITATILRALPLLSRLNSLLSTWDVRLLVLREIPGLLRALQLARSELDSALDMLKSRALPSENDALYSRDNYHAKQAGLEAIVVSAGRRMDRILDALEGREDSLPENWIDDLESIESDFSTWVMEAERRTVENEWLRLRAMAKKKEERQPVHNEASRSSDDLEGGTSKSAPTRPEPALQSGLPLLMETIDEEDDTSSEASPETSPENPTTTLVQTVDTPHTPDTHGPCLSSDAVDCPDTRPAEVPDPSAPNTSSREASEEKAIEAVVDAASPITERVPVQEVPVHNEVSSEESSDESLSDSLEESLDLSPNDTTAQDHEMVSAPNVPAQQVPLNTEASSQESSDESLDLSANETATQDHEIVLVSNVPAQEVPVNTEPSSEEPSDASLGEPLEEESLDDSPNDAATQNHVIASAPNVPVQESALVVEDPSVGSSEESSDELSDESVHDHQIQEMSSDPVIPMQESSLDVEESLAEELPEEKSTGQSTSAAPTAEISSGPQILVQEASLTVEESPENESRSEATCASQTQETSSGPRIPMQEISSDEFSGRSSDESASVTENQNTPSSPQIAVQEIPSNIDEHSDGYAGESSDESASTTDKEDASSRLRMPVQEAPVDVEEFPEESEGELQEQPLDEFSFASQINDGSTSPTPQEQPAPLPPLADIQLEPTEINREIKQESSFSLPQKEDPEEAEQSSQKSSNHPFLAVESLKPHTTFHALPDADNEPAQLIGNYITQHASNQEDISQLGNIGPFKALEQSDDSRFTVDDSALLHSLPAEDELATLASVMAEAATTEVPASLISVRREESPSIRTASPSLDPLKPSTSSDNGQIDIGHHSEHEHEKTDASPPRKQNLESPIKLSKRPARLDVDKLQSKPRRRTSNASTSLSDYPSLISSPEICEPRTTSSNGTPLLLETPPQFHAEYQSSNSIPSHSDHTLRADRLLRLDSQKGSSGAGLKHNRALSLPLQRFINERLDLNYENEPDVQVDSPIVGRRASHASVDSLPQTKPQDTSSQSHDASSSTPRDSIRRLASQHLEHSCEERSTPRPKGVKPQPPKAWNLNKNALKYSTHKALHAEPPSHPSAVRLRKQLTTHPSLESIGPYRSDSRSMEEDSAREKSGSRSSTPSKHLLQPRDELDEKVSSILATLPARIHLVSSENREFDTSSVTSSIPSKQRERFHPITPHGIPSRSSTPTPSLTLTPAVSRRRRSHAPEESSVKLYHLHRGGKTAPTKLFIRSVGENGERVMVRVGGGWADLGEYLREYAIHHGPRNMPETPRVGVQGLSTRESPQSPGSTLTPTGRTTPPRPPSVISNRPASSLAVRKIRRASNVSDITEFRSISAGQALNVSYSPFSAVSSRRRLSVSSNASIGGQSFASEIPQGSSVHSPSLPLGLAGPKPRSRRVSISPESEAWVEDVLGQARRNSLKPIKISPPPQDLEHGVPRIPTLPKSRSISDIGKAGFSRRVVLRGLGNPRT